jgi:hypothetical protein
MTTTTPPKGHTMPSPTVAPAISDLIAHELAGAVSTGTPYTAKAVRTIIDPGMQSWWISVPGGVEYTIRAHYDLGGIIWQGEADHEDGDYVTVTKRHIGPVLAAITEWAQAHAEVMA